MAVGLTTSHLERMISSEQLSAQLGGKIKAHTLHRWVRQGKLPGSILLGNKRWFDSRSASWILSGQMPVLDEPPARTLAPLREAVTVNARYWHAGELDGVALARNHGGKRSGWGD